MTSKLRVLATATGAMTAAAAALAGAGTAHASTLPTHNTKGATPAVKTFKEPR